MARKRIDEPDKYKQDSGGYQGFNNLNGNKFCSVCGIPSRWFAVKLLFQYYIW